MSLKRKAMAVGGVALGVLWWQLAPRASVVIRPEGVRPQGFQPEEFLAADVSFAALALVAGVILTGETSPR